MRRPTALQKSRLQSDNPLPLARRTRSDNPVQLRLDAATRLIFASAALQRRTPPLSHSLCYCATSSAHAKCKWQPHFSRPLPPLCNPFLAACLLSALRSRQRRWQRAGLQQAAAPLRLRLQQRLRCSPSGK